MEMGTGMRTEMKMGMETETEMWIGMGIEAGTAARTAVRTGGGVDDGDRDREEGGDVDRVLRRRR
jgi:hypothetical protein